MKFIYVAEKRIEYVINIPSNVPLNLNLLNFALILSFFLSFFFNKIGLVSKSIRSAFIISQPNPTKSIVEES